MSTKFATGGHAAQERVVKEQAERDAKRSGSFNTWEYLRLAAAAKGEVHGESKIIRFVTDEPDFIQVKQHSFVPTKPAPADYPEGRKWPSAMGGVCRYTKIPTEFDENGFPTKYRPLFDDCVIDDLELHTGEDDGRVYAKKAADRLWAVAVEREEVTDASGETIIQDVYTDVTINGETQKIKKFLVLNFGLKNFFDAVLGYHSVYKTLLDRDYKITRVGSGTSTDYNIVALDVIQEIVGDKVVKYDLRRPEIAAEYEVPFKLEDIVMEQASDEHYAWFFDPRVASSYEARFGKKDKSASTELTKASATEDNPEAEANRATLNAMRERLKQGRDKSTVDA